MPAIYQIQTEKMLLILIIGSLILDCAHSKDQDLSSYSRLHRNDYEELDAVKLIKNNQYNYKFMHFPDIRKVTEISLASRESSIIGPKRPSALERIRGFRKNTALTPFYISKRDPLSAKVVHSHFANNFSARGGSALSPMHYRTRRNSEVQDYLDFDIKKTSVNSLPDYPERNYSHSHLLNPKNVNQYPVTTRPTINTEAKSISTRHGKNLMNEYKRLDEINNWQQFANTKKMKTEVVTKTESRRKFIKGKRRKRPFRRGPIIRLSELQNAYEPNNALQHAQDRQEIQHSEYEDMEEKINAHESSDIKKLKVKKLNNKKQHKITMSTTLKPVLVKQYSSTRLPLPSLNSITAHLSSTTSNRFRLPAGRQSPIKITKNSSLSSVGNNLKTKPLDLPIIPKPSLQLPFKNSKGELISNKTPSLERPKSLNSSPQSTFQNPKSTKPDFKSRNSSLPKKSIIPMSSLSSSIILDPPSKRSINNHKPTNQYRTNNPKMSLLNLSTRQKSHPLQALKNPNVLNNNDDEETGMAPTFEFPFVSSIVSGLPFYIDGHQHLGPFQVFKINV